MAIHLKVLFLLAAVMLQGACCVNGSEIYNENFQEADLRDFGFPRGLKGEAVSEGDNIFLKTSGKKNETVALPRGKVEDFDLSIDIRGLGGIHFRNGFKVFFKPNGNMWFRRPGAMLLRWVREKRDIKKFHTVRVVCVGKIVRIYVDQKMELECLDYKSLSQPVFLRGAADFDNITIRNNIPDGEALIALPEDEGSDFWEEHYFLKEKSAGRLKGDRVKDSALIFTEGDEIKIPLQFLNEGSKECKLSFSLTVDEFDGLEKIMVSNKKSAVPAGGKIIEQVKAGKLQSGFYRVNISLSSNGKFVRKNYYPLFVRKSEGKIALKEAAFPVGIYLREIVWKPQHTKVYWHGIADYLQSNNFNTVFATGGCHREFPEIFEVYGINSFVRTVNRLNYPSVKGLLNTNVKKMKDIEAGNTKPVVTVLRAADVGTGNNSDPLFVWKETNPRTRMLLLNPYGKQENDINLIRILKSVRESFSSPWWAVLQLNGSKDRGAELRTPSPAEISKETHLALAYGAKGIFYYCLQATADDSALLDAVSLKPVDEKAKAAARMTKLITSNSTLLQKLRPASFKIKSSSESITVSAMSADGIDYVYAVNMSAINNISCRLSVGNLLNYAAVFGSSRNIYPAENKINFKAGEGKLLKITYIKKVK
ncbi:MAG: hypothetical protein ACYTFY_05560 [Planctomycetota bacterium]|jgi:hypothetical protein